jgi:alkaline phosphatase D
VRIIQISDTHLSAFHDHFAGNAKVFTQSLAALEPDLFVHTGDISMDGAREIDDLLLSKRWQDALPAPVLTLPGNHDVGDLASIRADQPLNDERLSAWRTIVGPDRWHHVRDGWSLVGLNAMLLGSGHPDEEAQFEWLETVLETDLPIALFTHKPLCIDTLDEGPCGYWTVAPAPRQRLAALLEGRDVRLIASGHLHIQRRKVIDGVSHVWAPASSFVVGAAQQDLGGERILGYAEHVYDDRDVTSGFVRPDGVEELLFDPVANEIYAPRPT